MVAMMLLLIFLIMAYYWLALTSLHQRHCRHFLAATFDSQHF